MRRVLPLLLLGLLLPSVTHAGGLIWRLPEENVQVQYEGQFTQETFRADSGEVAEKVVWLRAVIMRSLEKVDADYKGERVPCRWVEIKVITGKQSDTGKKENAGLDPGPLGPRLYRVLVPETAVVSELSEGKLVDKQDIFTAYLPIVKGYVRAGGEVQQDDGTIQDNSTTRELPAGVLQVYPLLSLVHHYRTMAVTADAEPVNVLNSTVDTKVLTGKRVIESRTHRTTNQATLYRSDNPEFAPFGLVSWKAETLVEEKDSVESRDEFRRATKVTEQLEVRSIISIDPTKDAELSLP